MKKRIIYIIFSLVLLAGFLFACENSAPTPSVTPSETPEIWSSTPIQSSTSTSSPSNPLTWQDAYAELLRESDAKEFFLCDADGDEIPEILLGGPATDTDKYAEYSVYTYKNNTFECLGSVSTLSWSCLWLDNDGGILGYLYGAGAGGTYRSYIKDGALYDDGEIYGYCFGSEGNQIEWFRGPDGEEIIVTKETKPEYQRIWNSKIELERYSNTEENIAKLIYDGGWLEALMTEKPESSTTSYLTFDDAVEICDAWLDEHRDLCKYAIVNRDYGLDPMPPPTYGLFDEYFYEIYVAGDGDGIIVLVHENTGELLSEYCKRSNDNVTVEIALLDDWYSEKYTEFSAASLNANEAVSVYNTWLDNHADMFEYRLNSEPRGEYIIFGEKYYYFQATEAQDYWYNILVHKYTGDMLHLYTSDGMYPETIITKLDDWYNSTHAQ